MSATPPPLPPPLPQSPAKADKPAAAEPPKPVQAANEPEAASRRVARRRPAGPVRNRIAANDDAPSIGGLIYALEQKPSNKPFTIAWVASGVWAAIGGGFSWVMLSTELGQGATLAEILTRPAAFMIAAAVILPIAVLWLLATLAWRAEELRLRSSTMTEVAIRLAEPDRMAEQSVASLGQAVRRQVSFMNDAVSRALGRAGELEALVHSEVAALERSYEENERRIRGTYPRTVGRAARAAQHQRQGVGYAAGDGLGSAGADREAVAAAGEARDDHPGRGRQPDEPGKRHYADVAATRRHGGPHERALRGLHRARRATAGKFAGPHGRPARRLAGAWHRPPRRHA